jgi:hypothetical protein
MTGTRRPVLVLDETRHKTLVRVLLEDLCRERARQDSPVAIYDLGITGAAGRRRDDDL